MEIKSHKGKSVPTGHPNILGNCIEPLSEAGPATKGAHQHMLTP
jgi:hypothetical protein